VEKGPATAVDAALCHDPDGFPRSLPRRPDTALPFDPTAFPRDCAVMLDTNVYIARGANRLPRDIQAFIATRPVLHSGVALAELSITAGLLDPADTRTANVRDGLIRLLDAIDLIDCRSPSPAAFAEAGMIAGILARTQLGLATPKKQLTPAEACCQTGRRREVLNDALIFLTARAEGAVLVSGNVVDIDLLLRFRPDAMVLLYRQTPA